MSLYQLQKLIYHVNRDAAQRERYRQDPAAFVKGYELSEAESAALLNVDVRMLYTMGVHSLDGRALAVAETFHPAQQNIQ